MAPNSDLQSYTIAPPADAPSLDLEKEFSNVTINCGDSKTRRPASSRNHHSSSLATSSARSQPSSSRSLASSSGTKAQRKKSGLVDRMLGRKEPATGHMSQKNKKHSSIHTSLSTSTHRTGPSRLATKDARIGDMARTFLEGMVSTSDDSTRGLGSHQPQPTIVKGMINKSEYERNNQKPYPELTNLMSIAPSNVKSILASPEDVRMASRQTRIDSLPPDERIKQELWAQSMVQKSAACPEGYLWGRTQGGYRCRGTHHLISHELLAEGKGGLYFLIDGNDLSYRYGPYYANPDDNEVFQYAGSHPKPALAPSFLTPGGSGFYNKNGEICDTMDMDEETLRNCTGQEIQSLAESNGLEGMPVSQARAELMRLVKMGKPQASAPSNIVPGSSNHRHGSRIPVHSGFRNLRTVNVNGHPVNIIGNSMAQLMTQIQAASGMHEIPDSNRSSQLHGFGLHGSRYQRGGAPPGYSSNRF